MNKTNLQDPTSRDFQPQRSGYAQLNEVEDPYHQQNENAAQTKQRNQNQLPSKGSSKTHANLLKNVAKDDYDELRIPPLWKLAEDHQKAKTIGDPDKVKRSRDQRRTCDCCGNYLVETNETLSLNCDVLKLAHMGAGFPLLFIFIKYCILICFTVIIVSGIYSFDSNIHGGNCPTFLQVQKAEMMLYPDYSPNQVVYQSLYIINDKAFCIGGGMLSLTLANKRYNEKAMLIQSCLNVVSVMIVIFVLHLLRYELRKMDNICDDLSISPADYSIIVKNIPTIGNSIDYYDELFKLFSKYGTVKQVNLCFDIDELSDLDKEIKELIKHKQSSLITLQKTGRFPKGESMQTLNQSIEQKTAKVEELQRTFIQGNTDKFVGVAFVSFDTEEMKETVISYSKLTFWQNAKRFFEMRNIGVSNKGIQFLGNRLKIEEAPWPTDIIWENQGLSTWNKFFRRLISSGVTSLFLVCSFLFVMYVTLETRETDTEYSRKQLTKNLLSKSTAPVQQPQAQSDKIVHEVMLEIFYELVFPFTIVSITIVAVNFVMGGVIHRLLSFEKHSTFTRESMSETNKTIIAQFLNNSLMLFVINYLLNHDLYGENGLLLNVATLFFTTTVIQLLDVTLNYKHLLKYLRRWWERRKGVMSVLTQQQAQKLYLDPPFEISNCYASIINLMYFTAFYATVVPMGLVISMVFLILFYWLLKYTLLRRAVVAHQLDSQITWDMVEMLEHFCSIYCFSNFIFGCILNPHMKVFSLSAIVSIIGVGVGLLNAILPMQSINESVFKIKDKEPNTIRYDQAVFEHFHQNYDVCNPATKEFAIKALILQKEHYLNNQKSQKGSDQHL